MSASLTVASEPETATAHYAWRSRMPLHLDVTTIRRKEPSANKCLMKTGEADFFDGLRITKADPDKLNAETSTMNSGASKVLYHNDWMSTTSNSHHQMSLTRQRIS